jgi:acyl dehydratase
MTAADQQNLDGLVGLELGTRVVTYSERDAILYALAIGAAASDLDLVYERDLRVLPTFALTLGLWALAEAAEVGRYDRTNTLHVGQSLSVRGPLPRRGAVRSSARIDAVWDKGTAAVVVVRVTSEPFDAWYTIFLPGRGGFGGERGSTSGPEIPSRDPDISTAARTWAGQAALYRLTGDRHPVHVDPAVALEVGFPQPILHGLATLGTVSLALANAAGSRPWDLTELTVRFASPVIPGDTIEIEAWREAEDIRFAAAARGGAKVLTAGSARFDRAATDPE